MSAVLRPAPSFEPMTEADLRPVLEIEDSIYAFPWTPGNFQDSLRAGYSCWVYRDGEELIGYAVLMLAGLRGVAQPDYQTEPETGGARPYVFILAIDGLRPDVVRDEDTPNLKRLAREGAVCWRGRVSVPSQTRVNFVTIATGAHADRHGIVGAGYRDGQWDAQRTDTPNPGEGQNRVLVPTVFEALERAGYRTAYLAMKGYELVGVWMDAVET